VANAVEEVQNTANFVVLTEEQVKNAVKQSTLPNGIRIVTKDIPSNLVSMRFAVLGGSSAETEAEKGAAHFLSVSAFAGTQSKTGLRLVRELEDLGATISASADREKITLDVTVLAGMAELAFERFAEAISSAPRTKFVLHDSIPAAQLAYDALNHSPKKLMAELLHEAAYGEATPMGSSFLANNCNLDSLCPDDVFKYRQHQYVGSNLVISANGISIERLQQYAEKYFKQLPKNSVDGSAQAGLPSCSYVGGDVRHKADCNGMTYFTLAFPVPAGVQAKPYNVLRTVLASIVQATQ